MIRGYLLTVDKSREIKYNACLKISDLLISIGCFTEQLICCEQAEGFYPTILQSSRQGMTGYFFESLTQRSAPNSLLAFCLEEEVFLSYP